MPEKQLHLSLKRQSQQKQTACDMTHIISLKIPFKGSYFAFFPRAYAKIWATQIH